MASGVPADSAAAQESPRARPKIGLALGGGSAKGISHVGVLRWLDEHRIPVDYVAGTSMGGLVGGAYASGMSPDEMLALFERVDWDLIFLPDAPYRLKGFRRKEDAREYPVKLELGLKKGLGLPSGLNPGHHIGLLLSQIALPYSDIGEFDRLPIPFRCVATDLKKGESVVLGKGSLSTALRATMAFPGVFDPVREGDLLLSDGGILDNVPVDVVKGMGAEVVIAVSVSDPSFDEVSESIFGIANRSISLMMKSLSSPRLDQADLVIRPNLKGVGSADYRDAERIRGLGYDAAGAQAERLQRYALDEDAWREHLADRMSRKRVAPREAAFYRVEGVPPFAADPLQRWLARRSAGVLDLGRLELDLDRIVGGGRYSAASYEIGEEEGGVKGVKVRISEKPHAPPFVNLSLDINNERQDWGFSLGAQATLMDVTSYASELRLRGSLGGDLGIGGELYQPLGTRGAFLSLHGALKRENSDVYRDNTLVAAYRRERSGGGGDLGWTFGAAELRAGYEADHVRAFPRIGASDLPSASGAEQSLRARFVTDVRDDAYLARSGVRIDTGFDWYLEAPDATERFGQLRFRADVAFRGAGHDRGFVGFDAGTSVTGEPPPLYQLTLGGPFRLSAFGVDEFRGKRIGLGRVGYLRSLARLPEPLAKRLYLVGLFEIGSAFGELSAAQLQTSVSAGLVVDTFFGPAFVGAAVGNGGAFRFYFTFGKLFR